MSINQFSDNGDILNHKKNSITARMRRKTSKFLKSSVVILMVVLVLLYSHIQQPWQPRDIVFVFPGTEPPSKGDKWVLYFCNEPKMWCGGLADRLKGMVLAYFISQLTDRKFGIHMKYPPCDYESFFQLDVVDYRLLKERTYERHVFTDDMEFYNHTKTINFDSFFKKDVLYIRGNFDYWDNLKINPLYQKQLYSLYPNYTYDQIFKTFFPKLFPLSTSLTNKFTKIMARAKPSENSKLACAHVRLGISETMPNEHVIRATMEDSKNVIEFLKTYKNVPNYHVFVMSDSEVVVREGRKVFFEQFIEVEGNVLHFELYEGDRKHICPAFERTILEHRILMQCDILVISKSGLSRTAAYVRGRYDQLYCLHKSEIRPCLPSQLRTVYEIFG